LRANLPDFAKIYDGSLEGRQRVTLQVLAQKMDDKNSNAPINRAIREITEMRVRESGRIPTAKEVITDTRFLARQNLYVAEAMREVGATYTFTPNKGYEFMNDPKAMTANGVRETASFPHRESRIDKDGNTVKKVKASAPQSASEAVKKMSPKKEPKPKPPTDILSKPPKASPPPAPPKPVAPTSPPSLLGGSLRMGGGGLRRGSFRV
jgi:hypothetical protein